MSVYKPKGSRFYQFDFQYKGSRFHGSTGQTTLRKAEEVERAKRETVALAFARAQPGKEPDFAPKKAMPTLDVAAQEWWENKGQHNGKPQDPADVRLRETRLANAVRFVGGDLIVTEITTQDISRGMQRRRGQLVDNGGRWSEAKVPSNSTVNRDVIDTIRPVIRHACKLRQVPAPAIDWGEIRLPEPKPKPKYFDQAQLAAIDKALPRWWRFFAHFQRRYALRVSEMFFSLECIDVPGRRITIPDRKGDDDHIIPVLADDMAVLAALKGRAAAAGLEHVWFRELKTGELLPLHRGGAVNVIRIAMRLSGMREAKGARGSHAFRHHAAMTYLRATKDLLGTKQLLGHANIQSTLTYAHALEDTVRAGLEAALKSQNNPEEEAMTPDFVAQNQLFIKR
ncbi:tyrosine-type recombinase/integrase [Caulobacter sp. CCNWLY153]|uniref:tyrosine-type recombinase/integrase n=1 Tax=unclassified Caulobacter TaxID=2648921 RepID=UPI002FEF3B9E